MATTGLQKFVNNEKGYIDRTIFYDRWHIPILGDVISDNAQLHFGGANNEAWLPGSFGCERRTSQKTSRAQCQARSLQKLPAIRKNLRWLC